MDVSTYNRAEQIGRYNWIVEYPASQLREEVAGAALYHRDRLADWTETAETTRRDMEAPGVRQRIRPDGSAVCGDETLVVRLADSEREIAHHRNRAEELEEWDGFLSLCGDRRVNVTADDAMMFELGEYEPASG